MTTIVGRLSMERGRGERPPSQASTMGEIAGAIIDKEAAGQIIDAINEQTEATIKLTTAVKASIRSEEALVAQLVNNTDAAKATSIMIDEARSNIRDLTRELIVRNNRP